VVPVNRLASAWSAEPLVLAAAALAAVVFAQACLPLRRRGRGDQAGLGRAALFASGLRVIDGRYAALAVMAERYLTLAVCVLLPGRSLLRPGRPPPAPRFAPASA
jgi:hypothetical protein